jgi:hypothetical protein
MLVELGARIPLTGAKLEATIYDPKASERDHAVEMASYGADIVRDANKPSASLCRETELDRLLSSPSSLDPFVDQDIIR